MITSIRTTRTDPCPGCDHTDAIRWVTSTPDADTWACRWCDTEWTVTVHVAGTV
jgi:hypothetical protein